MTHALLEPSEANQASFNITVGGSEASSAPNWPHSQNTRFFLKAANKNTFSLAAEGSKESGAVVPTGRQRDRKSDFNYGVRRHHCDLAAC